MPLSPPKCGPVDLLDDLPAGILTRSYVLNPYAVGTNNTIISYASLPHFASLKLTSNSQSFVFWFVLFHAPPLLFLSMVHVLWYNRHFIIP
jgi:hypothetical protein